MLVRKVFTFSGFYKSRVVTMTHIHSFRAVGFAWRRVALTAFACGMGLTTACQRQAAPPPQGPADVTVLTVAEEKILLTTELPGRTSPHLIAEIRPRVNGLIEKRLFTEGAEVKEGQDLYQIDPAPFQAALDNAKAALARSQASLPALKSRAERIHEALADKAVSQQDFDDADAALKQAEADIEYGKASVEMARINLGYTRIVSPISGRIGRSSVTDGAIVTAYQPVPLAAIQQLDPIYVDVPQSTAELQRLQRRLKDGRLNRQGVATDKVNLILGDGTPYAHEGTLQFQDITVDPTTGSVILRMVFPNPEGVLLPGMFVRTVVKEGVNEKALLIPQQAVARDPKGNPLALVVDASGKAEQRQLTLDRAIGSRWLVTSGLQAGDKVIVEGVQKARPGAPVKASPFVEGAPPAAAAPAGAPAKPAASK